MSTRKRRTRNSAKPDPEETVHNKRRKIDGGFQRAEGAVISPTAQSVLLLHAIRQPYDFTQDYTVPALKHDTELLVKVGAVGLNPIDWKAP